MRRVRFLADFQGVLTAEQFYRAGSEAEFDEAVAVELVADGRAEFVDQSASDEDDSAPPTKRKR